MAESTRSRGRGAVLAAVLCTIALLGVACGGGDEENTNQGGTQVIESDLAKDAPGPPTPGGTLSFGLGSETDGYDPSVNRWANEAYVVAWSIFDPLAAYDDKAEPTPYLAKSFEHNPEFTEWTIGIRENITFHDGSAVNADAVAKSLDKARTGALTGFVLEPIESITAADTYTVKVKMKRPWSLFPHQLANQTGAVMAPAMLAAGAEASRKPIGSGPFVFDNWRTDESLKVKKNSNYWVKDANGIQLPYFDEVTFRILTDTNTRANAFDSGEIDVFGTADPNQIAELNTRAKNGELKYFDDGKLEGEKLYIALNTSKAPFDDPMAREILQLIDDPEFVSQQAFNGVFAPVRGPFSENSEYYAGDLLPKPDLQRAIQLNEEYKQKYGKYLEFTANITPQPEVQRIAQILVSQAAQANVSVKLNSMDQTKLIADAVQGNYEATGFYRFGSPTIDRDFAFITDKGGPLNITRNENPRLTQAMEAARATDDKAKQIEQYKIVQEEIAKDMNMVFLVQLKGAIIAKNNINGLKGWTLPNGATALSSPPPYFFVGYMWRSR